MSVMGPRRLRVLEDGTTHAHLTTAIGVTLGAISAIVSDGFTVNWSHTNPANVTMGIVVEVSDSATFENIVYQSPMLAPDVISHAVTGLTPATPYHVRVLLAGFGASGIYIEEFHMAFTPSLTSAQVTTSAALPFVNDTMSGGPETLDAHVGENGADWTRTNGGVAVVDVTGGYAAITATDAFIAPAFQASGIASGQDQSVKATLEVFAAAASAIFEIYARGTVGGAMDGVGVQLHYSPAAYAPNNARLSFLNKNEAPFSADVIIPTDAQFTLELRIDGDEYRVLLNDVQIVLGTAGTAGTRVAIRFGQQLASYRLHAFVADNI